MTTSASQLIKRRARGTWCGWPGRPKRRLMRFKNASLPKTVTSRGRWRRHIQLFRALKSRTKAHQADDQLAGSGTPARGPVSGVRPCFLFYNVSAGSDLVFCFTMPESGTFCDISSPEVSVSGEPRTTEASVMATVTRSRVARHRLNVEFGQRQCPGPRQWSAPQTDVTIRAFAREAITWR